MENNNKKEERTLSFTKEELDLFGVICAAFVREQQWMGDAAAHYEHEGLDFMQIMSTLADKYNHAIHMPSSWCEDPECKFKLEEHQHPAGTPLLDVSSIEMNKVVEKYKID